MSSFGVSNRYKNMNEPQEHVGRPSEAFFRSMEMSTKSTQPADPEPKPFGWKTFTAATILFLGGIVRFTHS